MVCLIAAIVMTLSDFEGHSPIAMCGMLHDLSASAELLVYFWSPNHNPGMP